MLDYLCRILGFRLKTIYMILLKACLYEPTKPGRDERWDDFDVLKKVTRLKRKFTSLVKKLKCWLEDLVVEQDYCCCLASFGFQVQYNLPLEK